MVHQISIYKEMALHSQILAKL